MPGQKRQLEQSAGSSVAAKKSRSSEASGSAVLPRVQLPAPSPGVKEELKVQEEIDDQPPRVVCDTEELKSFVQLYREKLESRKKYQ